MSRMMGLPVRPDGVPVLLRRALVAFGLSDRECRVAIRRHELDRVERGAVATPLSGDATYDREVNRYVRRVAARALRVPSCVVSHLSAAALHGLPVGSAPLTTVHLTRLGTGGSRVAPGYSLHAASLKDDAIVQISGMRVTAVARTLVDVARTESMRSAVALADDALRQGLITVPGIDAALDELSGCPGMRRARRALGIADGRSESVGESFARVVFHTHGLDGLELQVEVRSAAGEFIGRCDFGLTECAVLIEFDGKVKYQRFLKPGEDPGDVVVREKLREDRLREAGFLVVRVSWDDLRRPAELMARVRRAMELGRRNVAAGLVTGVCRPISRGPA